MFKCDLYFLPNQFTMCAFRLGILVICSFTFIFLLAFYSKSYFTEVATEKCFISLVVLRKTFLHGSCFEHVRILEK